jgi:alpha-galactosidase
VEQCVGDTLGPGGIFRGLRTIPVLLDLCRDLDDLAPDALLLNYVNPMSINTWAVAEGSGRPVVGLCHSVQGTSEMLARWIEVPCEEVTYRCAGINHQAFFLEFRHRNEDLYPRIRAAAARPEIEDQEPVRIDMLRAFGYFVTESSGNASEYVPYYRKRKDLRKKYCRKGYNGGDSFYADTWPDWRRGADKYRRRIMEGKEELKKPGHSTEFASGILRAVLTDKPYVFHGSTWNTALIDNLPYDGVVEVPVLVDKAGLHPTHFGPLPDQCAALNRSHMAVNKLVAEACVKGNRDKALLGLMLDPLTAAVCSPAEIKEMFDRMFKAERKYLKGF